MNYWPYISVLLAAILWGTTGTAQSFIDGVAHPLTIGASRLSIGGFTLLAFVVLTKKLVWKDIPWKFAIISALLMALFQPLYFSAVQLTGVAIGTVASIGSAPMFSGLLEWLLLKRKPDRVWISATTSAVAGCLLLFSDKQAAVINPLGIGLALGAGLVFAGFAIASKKMLERMDSMPAVALIFSLGALALLPFLGVLDVTYAAKPANMAVLVYLGIGTTSVAYILFSLGLKSIPSSSAVTLSLGEPLTAALLGVFLVGEQLSAVSWSGVLLLLGGIIILAFGKKKSAI